MTHRLTAEEFARRYPAVARSIERIVLWPYRIRIRRQERVRIAALEDTIASVRSQHSKWQERGFSEMAVVLNVALYALLFDRDFAALKEFFLASDNDWNRRFVARQMAVMLYEGTLDLPVLLGKDLRAVMERLDISASTSDLNAIRSRLATFKRAHSGRLKEMRNIMAAHRERDVTLQFKLLDGLDRFEVYRTAVGFYEVILDLTPIITNILAEMGHPRRALKQIAAATRPSNS